MPSVIDMLLLLDQESVVQSVEYREEPRDDRLREASEGWKGLAVGAIPDTEWDFEGKRMIWKDRRFEFDLFPLTASLRCVALRRENVREKLMEAVLDQLGESVELYSADSAFQFANRACKQMLDIPAEQDIEGQKLLDIFEVPAEYSTNLTAMRTRAPVRDRFDSYKSTTGKTLTTVNYAYPVVEEGRLLGCVSFEWDMGMVQQKLRELEGIQRILVRHLPSPLKTPRDTHYTLEDLVGSSPGLLSAIELASRMAPRENSVLIQGETGTGKEIFAQGIHALSPRRKEKFVAVNCAAFPETLIEGMLFGTAKGAFTGSVDRVGLIEAANHGTLFLDEINSMSLTMQAKLLRVLQERTLRRVGSTADIPIDVRLIASTNEDAFGLIGQGTLRKDLFYRVASVIVEIPPLRERLEDLEALTWHYIRENQPAGRPIERIEPAFWQRLREHDWPGNVRELFHILSYAVNASEDGVLREENFPAYFLGRKAGGGRAPRRAEPDTGLDLRRGLNALVRDYEQHVLREAYAACGENATKTAELLGISRQSCQYYMKKYGLNR